VAADAKNLNVEPMLLTDKQLSSALNISVGHLHALDNSGKLPAPRKLGRCVRWSTQEIREWIAADCPDRAKMRMQGEKQKD